MRPFSFDDRWCWAASGPGPGGLIYVKFSSWRQFLHLTVRSIFSFIGRFPFPCRSGYCLGRPKDLAPRTLRPIPGPGSGGVRGEPGGLGPYENHISTAAQRSAALSTARHGNDQRRQHSLTLGSSPLTSPAPFCWLPRRSLQPCSELASAQLKKDQNMTTPKIALLFGTTDLGHLGVLVINFVRPVAAKGR